MSCGDAVSVKLLDIKPLADQTERADSVWAFLVGTAGGRLTTCVVH